MTDFPKEEYDKFKHLKQECFGDQKKVTEELLKTLGLNEEYLYKFVRKLQDLTDPVTKRIFKPSFSIDYNKSYNCYVTSHNGVECVCISDETETTKIVDFNPNNDDGNLFDDSVIVSDESTVVRMKNKDNDIWAEMQQHQSEKQVPVTTTKTVTENVPVTKTVSDGDAALDAYCHGAYTGMTSPNGHWFLGYDSSKIPDAVKKKPYGFHKNQVMRAVTFKAGRTGIITKINTGLMTAGNPAGNMIVEVVPVTKNGYPDRTKILARSKDKFKSASNKIHTFRFSKSYAHVTKGQTYAIIFSAPLCKNGNNYRLCGWRRACYTSNKKNAKNFLYSFGSHDGGKSWTKYMSNAKITGYSSYYDRPSAFPFEVTIKPTKTITTYQEKQSSVTTHGFTTETYNFYSTSTKDSLLLKLDIHGPIRQFQITGGSDQITDTNIMYYVSKDGRNFVNNVSSGASSDGSGWYNEQTCPALFSSAPRNLFVKALLSTTNQSKTPKLRNITVHVEYEKPVEAYVRTKPFAPEKDQMLAANVWENFDVNLENDNAEVYIDLIREDISKETFYFVNTTVADLQSLILEYATIFGKEISTSDIDTDAKILNFCKNDYFEDKEFINWLIEENNCYILGSFTSGGVTYKFFDMITLAGMPSYPIQATTNLVDDEVYEDFKNPEGASPIFDYSTSNRVSFPIPKQFLSGNKHIIDSISLIRTYAHLEDDEFVDDLVDEISLYEGALGTAIPVATGDSAGRLYDYTIDMTNKKIIFDITQGSDDHLFGRYCQISSGEVSSFTKYNESDKVYKLEIRSNGVKYVERLDFTTDYDSEVATITWNDEGLPIMAGQLTFEYNPVFCNNIRPEELLANPNNEKDYTGIKLDLWTESFNVTDEENEFRLKGYPVNQLREVYPAGNEDTQYTEDLDYVVDYEHKIIKFSPNIRGEVIVEYTPNLTDSELSLGIHIKRENPTDNCYIYYHSFSYRS